MNIYEISRALKPKDRFINIAYAKEGFENTELATQYGFAKYTLTELRDMLKGIRSVVEYKNAGREHRFALSLQRANQNRKKDCE